MNIKDRLQNFFNGRYGYDELNFCFLACYLLMAVINFIIKSYLMNILTFCLLIILLFRLLSKNNEKRRAENRKFLEVTAPIRRFIKNLRDSYKSDYRIFSCPDCRQRVRVPKNKGKIEIRCPKCSKTFIKRS